MSLKDPNLRFPSQPALVEDLDIFDMPDGLGIQIRGGATNLVVRGRLAKSLLPWLLNQLKQAASRETILSTRPSESTEAEIDELLLLLLRKGYLIESGKSSNVPERLDSISAKQRLFWGRKLGFTRTNAGAEDVEAKLRQAKILLVVEDMLGAATFDLMHRSGIGCIEVFDISSENNMEMLVENAQSNDVICTYQKGERLSETLELKASTADLLVTVTRNAPLSFFKLINRLSLDHQLNWLRANETSIEMELGPLLVPYDSACYCCMELRTRSIDDHPIEEALYQKHLDVMDESLNKRLQGEALAFAAASGALITMEAIRALTMISEPVTLGAVVFNGFDGHTQRLPIKKVARCPDCFRGSIEIRAEHEKGLANA